MPAPADPLYFTPARLRVSEGRASALEFGPHRVNHRPVIGLAENRAAGHDGIGAGGGVDGQVLVMHDMLGINKDFSPRFLRRYASLYEVIKGATENYIADVKSRDFPNEKEQY